VGTGGTLKVPVGVLAIDDVTTITTEDITDEDAARAGYQSLAALLTELEGYNNGNLYRIRFHFAGPDPRARLRVNDRLGAEELTALRGRLSRLDAASRRGAWTRDTLQLIEQRPNTRAADLAASLGLEKLVFKRDVRKLKELGLTESLEIGYRLSPRGRALLRHLD
jgi:DNA-binding transcriptional ArsR family regulator